MVAKRIAENVVALRRARGLSQGALASLAEIPRSTIAHLESGSGNPTINTLVALCRALQVPLEEVMAARRPECVLIRKDQVPVVERVGGAVRIIKLLPDKLAGMEIDRMELAPGVRMSGIPHLPRTKEYITLVEGAMTIYVAGESFELDEGDVLAFPGDRAHSYHNTGKDISVAFSVVVIAHLSS